MFWRVELALNRGAVGFGVGPGITAQIKGAAMELVGSRFGCDRDGAAGAVAGFGVHAVGRDDYFLNVVGIRNHRRFVAEADGAAVHFKIVLQVGAAAEIDAIGRPRVVRQDLSAGVDGGRLEQAHLERIAIQTRGFLRRFCVERCVLVGGIEVHRERLRSDGDSGLQ